VIEMQEERAVRACAVTERATGMQVIASKDAEMQDLMKRLAATEKQLAELEKQVVATQSETYAARKALEKEVAAVQRELEDARKAAEGTHALLGGESALPSEALEKTHAQDTTLAQERDALASEVASLEQAVAAVTAEKEERRQSAAEFQAFLFKEREADAKLAAERLCASLLEEVAMMEEAQRAAEDAAATAHCRIEVLEAKVADADARCEAMSQDVSESTQQLSDKLCAVQDELSKVFASPCLCLLAHTHNLTLSIAPSSTLVCARVMTARKRTNMSIPRVPSLAGAGGQDGRSIGSAKGDRAAAKRTHRGNVGQRCRHRQVQGAGAVAERRNGDARGSRRQGFGAGEGSGGRAKQAGGCAQGGRGHARPLGRRVRAAERGA